MIIITTLQVALFSLLLLFLFLTAALASSDIGDDDDTAAATNATATSAFLFLFLGLAVGTATHQLMSRLGETIPYTIALFIIGIVFSLALKAHGNDAFEQSLHAWIKIDPEVMLYIFLPPLIFSEAMNLNWFHVKGAFKQALTLAGPGVIIGAGVMGTITKFMLPYNWSWYLALMFGTIITATDTVAVVALLKTAGASPKLTMVVVGESLVNDGTAIVLFTLFLRLLEGEVFTVGQIISFFVSATVGSSLLGIVCGLVLVRWLRTANRSLKSADVTTQITITICSAYLIFYFAQGTLEISGALAVCCSGVVLAWLAPPIILNHEGMHYVWNIIEWLANTLIFLLAGLIIGHRILDNVTAIDWLYMLLLYLALMVSRSLVVALLFPFLSSKTHKLTVQEAVFISLASLRGALSMALALIVEDSSHLQAPPTETARMFFYVGGVATLTLVVNAVLAKPLLRQLRLIDDNSLEKRIVMGQVRRRLKKKFNKLIDDMAAEMQPGDLEELRQSCSLLRNDQQSSTRAARHEASGGPSQPRSSIFSSLRLSDYLSPLFGGTSRAAAGPYETAQTDEDFDDHSLQYSDMESRHSNETLGSKASFFNRSMIGSRFNQISGLFSVNSRNALRTVVVKDILTYMRGVFLEIVRVKYWHEIESGKLPRVSHSAQFLLYSVDVGLDEVRDGLNDWGCIERNITKPPWYIRYLVSMENHLPHWLFFDVLKLHQTLGRLEARHEKRSVYMLTSFIEAHEHSIQTLHDFIQGEDDVVTGDVELPEEIQVKREARFLIGKAKKLLADIPPEAIEAIRSKQLATTVLSKQAHMIKSMVGEGLISTAHAEEFLEVITKDAAEIELRRNAISRQQEIEKASHRESLRNSIINPGWGNPSSLPHTGAVEAATNHHTQPLLEGIDE